MTMITKYALFYFEDKTGISSLPNADGGYTLYRPTHLPENEYYFGDEKLEQRKAAYPFIYDNKYENLYPIAERLENPANNGEIKLTQNEILPLVFGIFDIEFDTSQSNSSSMMSMFGSMNIFNEMIDNISYIKRMTIIKCI